MKIFNTPEEMQSWAKNEKQRGRRIALVPTMGALHEGHLSLLKHARKLCDKLVLSIYVNPIQFGPSEDFARYPRDLDADVKNVEPIGVDAIFFPTDASMYQDGFQTYVNVDEVTKPLCGISRPGHFRGVATVVLKLLNIVSPDVAIFGEKDFQQLAMIRRMVRDLNVPVEIVGCPIVRETDGLAKSSRNAYLSEAERIAALSLSKSLRRAEELFAAGERGAEAILAEVRDTIEATGIARIDYAELVDAGSLERVDRIERPALVALAVYFGKTRLIDNRVLK